MTFVEPAFRYPPLVWGKDLRVTLSADRLTVSAEAPLFQEDAEAAPDLFRSYRKAVTRFGPQKRQGKNSPHIQFANAESDQQLEAFVKSFGPVVVSSFTSEEQAIESDGPLNFNRTKQIWMGEQDLAELRKERLVYRAALVLVAELKRGHKADVQTIQRCVCEIADNVSDWPKQWQRERHFRAAGECYSHEPMWVFGEDNVRHVETWKHYAIKKQSGDPLTDLFGGPSPIRAGHLMICDLVNAFPPHIYLWGETPMEAPGRDLAGGLRPVLYYILRREYLQASGIGVCRNTDCRELFEIERAGQEFCSDDCSRHQRQREYWNKRGKRLRKRRLKGIDQRRVKQVDRRGTRKR